MYVHFIDLGKWAGYDVMVIIITATMYVHELHYVYIYIETCVKRYEIGRVRVCVCCDLMDGFLKAPLISKSQQSLAAVASTDPHSLRTRALFGITFTPSYSSEPLAA